MTGRPTSQYMPLLWRVFLVNAGVLGAAATVAIFVLSPGGVTDPVALKEGAIFLGALALMTTLNVILVRRITTPLNELVAVARGVDPLKPGGRMEVAGPPSEATELAAAFNDMLERLEDGRRESARLALRAQESERLRVAQELHDEIGQSLTAALLQLGRLRKQAPTELREELGEAAETVRENLDELRRISQRLRPQDLDELGLVSALAHFAERLTEQTRLPVGLRLASEMPALTPEQELVIYRVAQEALTNVVRHSHASVATLAVETPGPGRVVLRVRDDGVGIDAAPPGGGIRGRSERALLSEAELDIRRRDEGGTEVVLDLTPGELSGR